jgi:hypothetical protein
MISNEPAYTLIHASPSLELVVIQATERARRQAPAGLPTGDKAARVLARRGLRQGLTRIARITTNL